MLKHLSLGTDTELLAVSIEKLNDPGVLEVGKSTKAPSNPVI
jgi:hypothetical protein